MDYPKGIIPYTGQQFERVHELVYQKGANVMSHGRLVHELVGPILVMQNPLNRMVTNPARRFNLPFAVSEWLSFMVGDDSLELPQHYIRDYAKFGEEQGQLTWHYATRMFREGNPWKKLVELIRNDQGSRQLYVPCFEAADLMNWTGNAQPGVSGPPCATGFQFLIRDGRLAMWTFYRSNDVWLGMPYDIFVASMIQEWLANAVGLPMGAYNHFATSLHLYDDHVPKALAMTATKSKRGPSMPPMGVINWVELDYLHRAYKNPMMDDADWYGHINYLRDYARDLAWCARAYVLRKEDFPEMLNAYAKIKFPAFKEAMSALLQLEVKRVK